MAKNLLNLAKGGDKKSTPATKKTADKKEIKKVMKEEIKLTPAEERDMKAKQKVVELLQDVQLTSEKKEDILEVVDDEQPKEGIEWLEEQVSLLSETNETLRSELALAKEDYQRIFIENQQIRNGAGISSNDGDVKLKVIELFNELQENHLKLGVDQHTGIGNFRIFCPGFLNRMVIFFPFLANMKRY